jgi:signal peptidase II
MNPTTGRRYLWLFALLAVIGLAADQASKYIVFAHLYSEEIDVPSIVVIGDCFHLQASHAHYKKVEKIEHPIRYVIRDPGDQPLSFLRTISGECQPSVNRGALFGLGNADAENGGWNVFFLAVSLLAAAFVVFWVMRPAVAQDRFLCLALGLILGGTLGNLYDRIVFSGVRDFLHCYYGSHVWPDFNIADCCLVSGAAVLLIHSFFIKDPATEPAKTEATVATAPTVETPA